MRPAFPLAIPSTCSDYDYGMSVREYLVGCALQGAAARWLDAGDIHREEFAKTIADVAVRVADATIKRMGHTA